jgi:hypothetical protein
MQQEVEDLNPLLWQHKKQGISNVHIGSEPIFVIQLIGCIEQTEIAL